MCQICQTCELKELLGGSKQIKYYELGHWRCAIWLEHVDVSWCLDMHQEVEPGRFLKCQWIMYDLIPSPHLIVNTLLQMVKFEYVTTMVHAKREAFQDRIVWCTCSWDNQYQLVSRRCWVNPYETIGAPESKSLHFFTLWTGSAVSAGRTIKCHPFGPAVLVTKQY